MKKHYVFTFCALVSLCLIFALAEKAKAADTLVFDSSDTYIGACSFTNKSAWQLKEDISVTTFQIWYKWNQGETSFPVKVTKDGKPFAEFDVTRGNCDPYQQTWCNADYVINKLFPKGDYTTEITESRQCLKPGVTGVARLYTDDGKTKVEVTPTPVPTTTLTPEPTRPVLVAANDEPKTVAISPSCNCNQTKVYAAAGGVSFVISLLVSLLLRRR
jgi:hypothetical protein